MLSNYLLLGVQLPENLSSSYTDWAILEIVVKILFSTPASDMFHYTHEMMLEVVMKKVELACSPTLYVDTVYFETTQQG